MMTMNATEEKKRRIRKVYSGKEKSQAVLSLWAGRRNPSAISRELGMAATTLDGWQRRALKGMLKALGPGEWRAENTTGLQLPEMLERVVAETLGPKNESEGIGEQETKTE